MVMVTDARTHSTQEDERTHVLSTQRQTYACTHTCSTRQHNCRRRRRAGGAGGRYCRRAAPHHVGPSAPQRVQANPDGSSARAGRIVCCAMAARQVGTWAGHALAVPVRAYCSLRARFRAMRSFLCARR